MYIIIDVTDMVGKKAEEKSWSSFITVSLWTIFILAIIYLVYTLVVNGLTRI